MTGKGPKQNKEVVLLHYSPDAEVVGEFRARLEQLGIDPWEYTEDMRAGDDIRRTVQDRIDGARLVLLCASDAAIEKPWFKNEWEWCSALLRKRYADLLLFQVGDLTPSKFENLPATHAFFDLRDRLGSAVDQVHEKLGRPRDVRLACAVFAMTSDQCSELLEETRFEEARAKLEKLAVSMGIAPGDWERLLRARYGEKPEDLRPFADPADPAGADSILHVVGNVLTRANERRIRQGEYPVRVRWFTNDLSDFRQPAYTPARRVWEEGDALVVVDGASVLHSALLDWPDCKRTERCAAVWMPPFMHHTNAQQELVAHLAGSLKSTATLFQDWVDGVHLAEGRELGFDFAFPSSLDCWLFRTLAGAGAVEQPHGDTINSLGPRVTDLGQAMGGRS